MAIAENTEDGRGYVIRDRDRKWYDRIRAAWWVLWRRWVFVATAKSVGDTLGILTTLRVSSDRSDIFLDWIDDRTATARGELAEMAAKRRRD